MDPLQNRWLIVRKGVILTPSISPVIAQLDGAFGRAAVRSHVTSGLRTAADQIRIILDAGFARGLTREWPELRGGTADTLVIHAGQPTPLWYVVWGRLLTIGFLVNPPVESEVPFDYVHPSGRRILAGTTIRPSSHFRGTAFDIGGSGGTKPRLDDELAIVDEARRSGRIQGITAVTIERENNCLHIECVEVKT